MKQKRSNEKTTRYKCEHTLRMEKRKKNEDINQIAKWITYVNIMAFITMLWNKHYLYTFLSMGFQHLLHNALSSLNQLWFHTIMHWHTFPYLSHACVSAVQFKMFVQKIQKIQLSQSISNLIKWIFNGFKWFLFLLLKWQC